MSRYEIGMLNTIVPFISLFCYHYSEQLHFKNISDKHNITQHVHDILSQHDKDESKEYEEENRKIVIN
jgi:hypothetical protein